VAHAAAAGKRVPTEAPRPSTIRQTAAALFFGAGAWQAGTVLAELSLSALMVSLTVVIHGAGLLVLARVLRLEAQEEAHDHLNPASPRALAIMLGVILGLFALHGVEIWIYALLYLSLGAVEGLRESVYFSTITYGAIGYDDSAMAERWRLVSAIEGINGIILIGWSTAFFITVIARLRRI
jgi:hypothetical protein